MEENKNMWYGYQHQSGTLQANRYFDQRDTDEAKVSPFVKMVIMPFEAKDREEALQIIEAQIQKFTE